MHSGRSNPYFAYDLDNQTIQQVNEEKIFSGIVFDNQLKLHPHTALVARKADRILALINQCFNTLDSTSFMTLYKTLVCPTIEYGNVVYGPHTIAEIKYFRIGAA